MCSPSFPYGESLLLSLPIELLQDIISDIDSPRDLLCLALTSRPLCNQIIPHHIDFRYLKCSTLRPILWTFLYENPIYASRIREVRLIMESSSLFYLINPPGSINIPRMLRDEVPEQEHPISLDQDESSYPDLHELIRALGKMVNLQKFFWHPGVCPRIPKRLEIGNAIRGSGCKLLDLHGGIRDKDIQSATTLKPYNVIKRPVSDLFSHFTRLHITHCSLALEYTRRLSKPIRPKYR